MVEYGLFLRPTEKAFRQIVVRDSFTEGKAYPVEHSKVEGQYVICDDVDDFWAYLDDRVNQGMFEVLSPEDIIEETLEKIEGNNTLLNRAILNLRDTLDLSTDATVVDLATVLINLEIE